MRNYSMYDENKCNKMNGDTLQSSVQKQNHASQKFSRLKRNLPKKGNNVTISMKNRRSVLSKALASAGDSLINVQAYKHRSTSTKTKQDIITINVSGNRYQTRLLTLENYPNTLLGNKQKRELYWNSEENEYYFDRHRACFEAILYYYQSNGRLRRPDYVPLDTFLEEVSFFDLGAHAISEISKQENVSIVKYIDLPTLLWRRYIWFYLEYPQHSTFAKIVYFTSMILTALSCVELAIETIPYYSNQLRNLCAREENVTLQINDVPLCTAMFSSPFFIIQTICVSYFTIEFILRLISTPSYWKFILTLFNWIDLGAIVPYFIFLCLALTHTETNLKGIPLVGLRVFRVLRFLRVFKIYFISKQLKSLHVLSSTLKESFWDFVIMIVILTLLGFLFGAAIYFAEQRTNGEVFDSILKSTYWGIITITSTGYGDMYPITVAGRILACLCAFIGLGVSGILVSVLVTRYQHVYNRRRFFPEQIISAMDSFDNEHYEKQDFINRKLTGTKRLVLSTSILPQTSASRILAPIDYRNYLEPGTSSSNIRFIITLIDDTMDKRSVNHIESDIMEELTEIVKRSGEEIRFKLISPKTEFSIDQISTTLKPTTIQEEKEIS